MAKMTLLEMTQNILSDMDSDEVNSITDTQEATQVAHIIKTSYYNIVDGTDYPFLYELFKMTASGTADRPTHMSLPEDIIDLKWVKYNNKKTAPAKDLFKEIQYKTPENFVYIVDQRDSTATNIKKVTDPTGITLNILNDKCPQYFTSFDDETIVFDSYLATLDSTLQATKSQCYGKRSVAFTLSDTFTPDLPVQLFSYLLSDAKSTAFVVLKQMANPKAEQTATSQRRRMSQDAWKIKNGISYPNYGRYSTRIKKPNY
tara:strand:- start:14007 stop:14783 length:777 start_codon:yes stop_codon:yes gene_type:complete